MKFADAREAARAYLARGFAIIPLLPGQKGTTEERWLDLVFTDEDVSPGDNIGIKTGDPSRGLVDSDLDAKEAAVVADHLLPKTGLISGRPGKPRSHRFYMCAIKKTHKFKDIDDSSLLELRANRAQTMMPPSKHPSGEEVMFYEYGEPSEQEPHDLLTAHTYCAVGTIVARHYPGGGARHEAALALGGFLARLGVPPDACGKIAAAAADAAGDREVSDRERAARESAQKVAEELSGGEPAGPTTGGVKLQELLGHGPEVVKRIRSWFGAEASKLADRHIDALNDRHAIVFMTTGDMVVITEDYDDLLERRFLRYSSFDAIRNKYPEKIVVGTDAKGQPVLERLGKWWLEHPRRRKYEGIDFRPGADARPEYYNLWRGFAITPEPGDWSLFRDHIKTVVCDGDPKMFAWLLAWMAAAVQRPGEPAEVAVAIRGGQGAGKGMFAREFGRLFGQHFVHLDSARHLTGNFNAHLHDACVVFADEAAWPGDKAGLGALKRIITEPTIAIERKGVDVAVVKNVMHLILASNEDWVVPAGLDDRRFFVLDASNARAGDTAYFAAVRKQMREQGGAEAMLHDLMTMDLTTDRIDLRKAPQTKGLLEQKTLSMDPALRWWHVKLGDGRLTATGTAWPREVDSDTLYDDYVAALQAMGVPRRATKVELAKLLSRILPDGTFSQRRKTVSGSMRRMWTVPPLAECRRVFAAALKAHPDRLWPDATDLLDDGGRDDESPFPPDDQV